jgi:hypothetical protein
MTAVASRKALLTLAVVLLGVGLAAVAMLTRGAAPQAASAASHREAPMISLDAPADITDFFMFRSYESGNADKVVLVMDTQSSEPSAGPNYWNFDPGVKYLFNVDNNQDGTADDVVFEVTFENEIRGVVDQLDLFLNYVALPPITALDGAGSEGLGFRQTYEVTMIKKGRRTELGDDLIAVPSNVGPRTMPDYDALTQLGIYDLGGGIRVYAGQRDDPFYIDLGAVFDTLNLRSPGTDMLSGFNVQTIALELPSALLTGNSAGTLGAYASTERHEARVRDRDDKKGKTSQVQRLANPLVNEAIIGTEDKDEWNTLDPSKEKEFEDYYVNPRLATALEVVFGAPASPLFDLRDVFLRYTPGEKKLSELLRLNLGVDPTPLASQNPLTVLAGDAAGWPNGRRPIDDVTDIAVRVVGGTNYLSAGDSVDANDVALPDTFPFLSTPHDGRGRFHANP